MFSNDCNLRSFQLRDRRFCKPPSLTYVLGYFALVPPFKNFRKWPILLSLLNLPELGFVALKVWRYGVPNERVLKSPLKQWVSVKGGGVCGGRCCI